MDKSTKIWLVISSILLIVLGIFCIAKPGGTLLASAWLIGCFFLFNLLETAVAIPVVFSLWVMFEGIIIFIHYNRNEAKKQFHFLRVDTPV
ncbi:MAG: DUF308 domain-containing protein [Muribaculaceae bacterium]|nr:DUF308 domain-containing protein [Muribaculaceae bacterium]